MSNKITPPTQDRVRKLTNYQKNIQERSFIHYILGLLVRWKQNFKYAKAKRIARKRGATIGEGVIMSVEFAKTLNSNVHIGNHVSLHNPKFSSFRYPIYIGNNVIIGNNVDFVMGGHNIDSPDWEHCRHSEKLVIEDYVWLCPNSVVLPSVQKISYGTVLGSYSVLVKDTTEMAVMGGNPAKEIRKRNCIHSDLVVESLLGGDYEVYKDARKLRSNI